MANKRTPIQGTITNTADSTHDHEMAEGGAFVADFEWVSGSPTFTIKTKIPGGDSFVEAVGADGSQLAESLSTTSRHGHIEVLALPGQLFRISGSGTGEFNYAAGRTGTY